MEIKELEDIRESFRTDYDDLKKVCQGELRKADEATTEETQCIKPSKMEERHSLFHKKKDKKKVTI